MVTNRAGSIFNAEATAISTANVGCRNPRRRTEQRRIGAINVGRLGELLL
jgi:hypothetical protein